MTELTKTRKDRKTGESELTMEAMKAGDYLTVKCEGRTFFAQVLSVGEPTTIMFLTKVPSINHSRKRKRSFDVGQFERCDTFKGCNWKLNL